MKKKILFLITTLAHGGAERVLVNLANNLNAEQFDVTIHSIFDGGVNKKYILPHVHYRSTFHKTFHGIKYLTSFLPAALLHKLFIRGQYDYEIAYLEGPPAKIISGADLKKSIILSWIHIELLNRRAFTEGFFNLTDAQRCYRRFNMIACVSNTVKNSFEAISGIDQNLCVLYNTNDTERIRTKAEEDIDQDFSHDLPTICSVAKIEESKGYDRLLEVHKRLIDEEILHEIIVMGIGSQRSYLEQKAKELGVSKSFRFIGFQENPYKYVARADLYVCPSRREGFSTSVTEALILGIPVVSTDCSGAKELLGDNNEYGLVVENSVDGIYEGLKLMLSNPVLLKQYKHQAEHRGNDFSKENTVQAVEKMLGSL